MGLTDSFLIKFGNLCRLKFLLPAPKVLFQLLDQILRIVEVLLAQIVNSVQCKRQRIISNFASLFVILDNFIVEHRHVQYQAQSH